MAAGVHVYAFGWPDGGVPELDRMMDIVQVSAWWLSGLHGVDCRALRLASVGHAGRAPGRGSASLRVAASHRTRPVTSPLGGGEDDCRGACRGRRPWSTWRWARAAAWRCTGTPAWGARPWRWPATSCTGGRARRGRQWSGCGGTGRARCGTRGRRPTCTCLSSTARTSGGLAGRDRDLSFTQQTVLGQVCQWSSRTPFSNHPIARCGLLPAHCVGVCSQARSRCP